MRANWLELDVTILILPQAKKHGLTSGTRRSTLVNDCTQAKHEFPIEWVYNLHRHA